MQAARQLAQHEWAKPHSGQMTGKASEGSWAIAPLKSFPHYLNRTIADAIIDAVGNVRRDSSLNTTVANELAQLADAASTTVMGLDYHEPGHGHTRRRRANVEQARLEAKLPHLPPQLAPPTDLPAPEPTPAPGPMPAPSPTPAPSQKIAPGRQQEPSFRFCSRVWR